MKESILPNRIDIFRFAEQSLSLNAIVYLSGMDRLKAYLFSLNEQQKADVTMSFGVDEHGITYVIGHLTVTVFLQCQRCMEALSYEIITPFALGVVKTLKEADALPAQYEPFLVEDQQLALHELVEEEIILNLPIISRHPAEVCRAPDLTVDQEKEVEQEEKKNPFHLLKSLKHKQ